MRFERNEMEREEEFQEGESRFGRGRGAAKIWEIKEQEKKMLDWDKGLAQKHEAEDRLQELVHERGKPFAQTKYNCLIY